MAIKNNRIIKIIKPVHVSLLKYFSFVPLVSTIIEGRGYCFIPVHTRTYVLALPPVN